MLLNNVVFETIKIKFKTNQPLIFNMVITIKIFVLLEGSNMIFHDSLKFARSLYKGSVKYSYLSISFA